MNASPNVPASGRRRPTMSASTSVSRCGGSGPASAACRRARASMAGSRSTPGDPVPGLGERDGQPPGPDGELEDRPAGPGGQREVEIEVARVVDEVEVVQAGERLGGRRIGAVEHSLGQPGWPWCSGGLAGKRPAGSSRPAQRTACAGLAPHGEGADRLERCAVGDHRGRLGVVVRRRDLDDVHARQVDGAHDLADRAQHLAAEHPARLRRAGPGRHPRVDHVDVEAQVDEVRAVERLVDRLGDDRFRAALLDLAHEVPAQPLLLHPLEGLDRRPVAAQADLDEVLALDRARFDEPPHRRPVAGQDAPVVRGRVGVGVEMDDPDAARVAEPRRPPSRSAR